MKKQIVEKQLGIAGDYQYRALHKQNYLQSNWHYDKLIVIERLLNEYKTKTLLDLGTGSGNLELTYSSKLDRILGVDYNDEALKFLQSQLSKRKIKNVKLVYQNILDVAIISKLGKFDMIIMVDVIEHLEATSGKKLISSFKKLLTPEGKIVIITPNYSSLWPAMETFMDKFTSIPHLDGMQHVTKFTPSLLEETFKKNGNYKMVEFTTFNSFAFLFPWKVLSKMLTKLEFALRFPFGNLLVGVFET